MVIKILTKPKRKVDKINDKEIENKKNHPKLKSIITKVKYILKRINRLEDIKE